MKKSIYLILITLLVATAFSGCKGKDSDDKLQSANKTYEATLDIFVNLLTGKNLSSDEVEKLQPKGYFAEVLDFSEYYDRVQQQIKTNNNTITTSFGKGYEASYKIIDDVKMSTDEKAQATKKLNSVSWYDANDLKEARQLVVEISIEGDERSQTFEAEIQVMQLEDEWYILGYVCEELDSLMN